MQRSLSWIALALIGTTVTGCDLANLSLGRKPRETTVTTPPMVSDQPRTVPLQPGENVIVKAVNRVGPAVVRIDTVKKVNNPLGGIFGLGPSTSRQQGQGSGFITRANGLIFTNEMWSAVPIK